MRPKSDPPPVAVATRSIEVWQPRPHDPIEAERVATAARVRDEEHKARLALAEARRMHADMQHVGFKFLLRQFEKWLRMSELPEFENNVGPIDPKTVLKMAEFVSKNFRLDTGQATENIATHVTKSVDFTKLTQEERNAWRALAVKAGADENE